MVLVVAIIVYFFVWPWVMIAIGLIVSPNPPKPEITYGEFPFRLVYEINGQQKMIEDTLICEYDGIGLDEGRGKYRKWKQRLASENESIILLKVDDTKEIEFFPGSAAFYMGDSNFEYYMDDSVNEGNGSSFPNALLVTKDGRFTSVRVIEADQLLKEYNIQLISWDASPPIKNHFSKSSKK